MARVNMQLTVFAHAQSTNGEKKHAPAPASRQRSSSLLSILPLSSHDSDPACIQQCTLQGNVTQAYLQTRCLNCSRPSCLLEDNIASMQAHRMTLTLLPAPPPPPFSPGPQALWATVAQSVCSAAADCHYSAVQNTTSCTEFCTLVDAGRHMLTEMVVDHYIPNDTHMTEDEARVQVCFLYL